MIISDCRSSKKKTNVHAFYSCFNIIPVTILWKCHGDFFGDQMKHIDETLSVSTFGFIDKCVYIIHMTESSGSLLTA